MIRHINEVQANLLPNPKCFRTFVHSKNKTSRISGKMFFSNDTFNLPHDFVNRFVNLFSSVFTPSDLDSASKRKKKEKKKK